MTTDELTTALHACAAGLYSLEAGVALLTAEGTFLRRDFTSRFITTGTSIGDGTTPMAAIDWDAAITALHAGEIPCSGGERRVLMLSASLAVASPSISVTLLPASTTATSSDWSPRSCTRPENAPNPDYVDDRL